jgi:hypothetical protein
MSLPWTFIACMAIAIAQTTLVSAQVPAAPADPTGELTSSQIPAVNDVAATPLSLPEALKLRTKRQSTHEIVGKALNQGTDFEVTAPVRLQLGKVGFSEIQIDNFQNAFGRKPSLPGKPGSQLPLKEPERKTTFWQIEEVTKTATPELKPIQTPHVTLWVAEKQHELLLPELQKLDQLLAARFQEPLRSGLDQRAAHIVLTRSKDETEKWVGQYFDSVQLITDLPGGKVDYVRGFRNGMLLSNVCVRNCDDLEPALLRRYLAMDVGYMAFLQATGNCLNEPLATGFVNYLEAAATGSAETPIFAVRYGVDKRQKTTDKRKWEIIVKSRWQMKKLTTVPELLKFTTAKMTLPEFAESWSLVDLLASDQLRFGKLLYALRDEEDPLKAIESVYGWTEDRLTQEWHQHLRKYSN